MLKVSGFYRTNTSYRTPFHQALNRVLEGNSRASITRGLH